MSFFSRLTDRARAVDSLVCVGLDPHREFLAEQTAAGAEAFCLRLIECTEDSACAFKPNSAFFEALGPSGLEALRTVIAAVPEGIPIILDAKRGDIPSTAVAYAQAAFEILGAQAITLNPYLGRDSIEPFLSDPERGVFLLCKTSNPGSEDLQSLALREGESLYERVARLAEGWNTADNIGLVVGATDVEALASARAAAPNLWILAPGVGAQGGGLEAAVRAGLRADGLGLLLPFSRSLARAIDPGAEVERLRQAISQVRGARPGEAPGPLPAPLARLADALLAAGCVRFGEFTLRSGMTSPIYLDLRRLVSSPDLLAQVAAAYRPLLDGLRFDRLAALPYAALPIGTALSLQTGWPLVYPRKEAKEYGTRTEVEGDFQPGETVVVIDDVATTGESKLEAVHRLQAAGLVVHDVVVLIDRQSGAGAALAKAGYRLHAARTLTQLLDHWERSGKVPQEMLKATRRFLSEHRS